jgi:DUF1680 family protein
MKTINLRYLALTTVFSLASTAQSAGRYVEVSYPSGATEVAVVDRAPDSPQSTQYVGNRAPLLPSSMLRLPPGAVRPQGWLAKVLRLQADGFHGRLGELSRFLKKDGNAWLARDGKGDFGWEEVPYWLKGYLNCAYVLDDERMKREAQIWIEGAINSQQQDGWFGPGAGRKGVATDLVGRDDLWPNMIMLFCLQDYFEHTGDRRVLTLMTRYFRYLEKVPEERFLVGYWPSRRGGDQLYSILWLYNHTGEKWLLDLAHKTHRRTAHWDKGLIDRHNVNIAQGFREPATYALLSRKDEDRRATARVWAEIRNKFGHVPGGMFGADEDARDGHTGPRQAIETCGMVEEMLSDELLIAMTGATVWAERCENVAFNSLPAAFTADMKALRYLTSPNLPQSDHASKAPGVENGGPMFHMNPYDHRCCQHNSGHGWPYFTEHLWYATTGDGFAAYLYGPCLAKGRTAGGVEVTIDEKTRYPFDDTIRLTVSPARRVRFPLYLRIPAWCPEAELVVNGVAAKDVKLPGGKVARLEREWQVGDQVTLKLPMPLSVKVWTENRGTVSVNRGPLTYSLLIKEKYVRHGGTDAWPAWDIFPDSPWNYGLVLDPKEPASMLKFETGPWPANDQPFTHEGPVKIRAKAKRIPNWTLDRRGLVREVVQSPVLSNEPVGEVTLIPMGAARLRLTAFPLIGTGKEAKEWPTPFLPDLKPSASHCFENDTVDALCDGVLPKNSADQSIDRFTWWPRKGTVEWVQYDFPKARAIDRSAVYWFVDHPKGGCKLPKSWRLLYHDGKGWQPVAAAGPYPLRSDQFCEIQFGVVTTTAVRLEVQLEPGFSAGILEWQVPALPATKN